MKPVVLLTSTLLAAIPSGGANPIACRVLETLYGPDVRHMDWVAEAGAKQPGGGGLHLFGAPVARVRRSDCPHGGGGDVRQNLQLDIDRVGDTAPTDAQAVVHFNADKRGAPDSGIRVTLAPRTCTVTVAGDEVTRRPGTLLTSGRAVTITLTTLGRRFSVAVDSETVASGVLPPPYTANEGWTVITAENCDIRIMTFAEEAVAVDRTPPAGRRTELLYEETFTAESLAANWITNPGADAEMAAVDGRFVIRHMCNAFLRRRFTGPLALDCTVTPVPTTDFPAGVTDVIVIWMIDQPDGDFLALLDNRTRNLDAGLPGLMPLPFYWVDFGGSNNVTTRMRRNPRRQMIRQFTDRARLLERGRTYDLTAIQNGDFTEFHVDGTPWIQAHDENPLISGHLGFRAFCAGLEVHKLRVWRLAEP